MNNNSFDQSFINFNNLNFLNKKHRMIFNYENILPPQNLTSNLFDLNNCIPNNPFKFSKLDKIKYNNANKRNQTQFNNNDYNKKFYNEQNDLIKSYQDYFLKTLANITHFHMASSNDIINNIIINNNIDTTPFNEKYKIDGINNIENNIKNKSNRICENNDNKIDFSYLYGHPDRIKYKTIRHKLSMHKKMDNECREDTFYLLHVIKKLKLLLENMSNNRKNKNRKSLEKLKNLYNKSILSLDHKLYAQDILGNRFI